MTSFCKYYGSSYLVFICKACSKEYRVCDCELGKQYCDACAQIWHETLQNSYPENMNL
jgi:hypothetical protein